MDWIDGKRVAALVYKRRLHIINVFLSAVRELGGEAPRATGFKGYNAISWTSGGMTHWAVSDLNAKEFGRAPGAVLGCCQLRLTSPSLTPLP